MNIGFLLGAAGVCLILIGIIGFVLMYNRLQRLSVKVDEAASGIDVALEKRWDLLNELLAAVKKYLTHEYETLTGVTALRSGTEAEKRRLDQQAEASAETVRSIDREIELQGRNLEKIRRQLEEERDRGGRFRNRRENPGSQELLQGERRQAGRRRTDAVSQKIGVLSAVHRDLSGVTAGIDALYEQYPC